MKIIIFFYYYDEHVSINQILSNKNLRFTENVISHFRDRTSLNSNLIILKENLAQLSINKVSKFFLKVKKISRNYKEFRNL